jgi:FkbM family methyltransferase
MRWVRPSLGEYAVENRAELDVDRKVLASFFAGQGTGLFVDVGAARPDYLSVSALFRDAGWRVLAIEPNPEFAELHRLRGHEVYEYACGTADEDDVDFSIADSHGQEYHGGSVSYESFSSLSLKPGYEALLPPSVSLRPIKVSMRRLDTILLEAGVPTIDVVSIDVEGWEIEVLRGLDLERYDPKVIIIENFLKDPAYDDQLKEWGYVLWRTFTPNQVYVRPGLLDQLPLHERVLRKAKKLLR